MQYFCVLKNIFLRKPDAIEPTLIPAVKKHFLFAAVIQPVSSQHIGGTFIILSSSHNIKTKSTRPKQACQFHFLDLRGF